MLVTAATLTRDSPFVTKGSVQHSGRAATGRLVGSGGNAVLPEYRQLYLAGKLQAKNLTGLRVCQRCRTGNLDPDSSDFVTPGRGDARRVVVLHGESRNIARKRLSASRMGN